MKPIRVLIVDDSALVRRMLREILGADRSIEVVGHAADPFVAREKIKKLNPDVLTLDIEMPKMDGIKFLRNLMRLRPMPVVMVSSLTQRGAAATLEALELGAVDYVSKPRSDLAIEKYAKEIVAKVKLAASARVRALEPTQFGVPHSRDSAMRLSTGTPITGIDLIAVGASTGGTEAMRELLHGLPAEVPGVVMVQHIPKEFSRAFAARLDNCCALAVKEAEDGEAILPRCGYVAPGDRHLTVRREGNRYRCQLDDGARVNQHRPSVDVLFRSVARAAGGKAMGIIMTGMGADGAHGLSEMHAAGATTIAQDESSSVVWGMPKEAVDLGCVDHVLSLADIPNHVAAVLGGNATANV